MKKWILMLLALVLCGVTQAQNAEVTLNNGTFVKGDIGKFSFNVDNYHEFRIKKTDGEKADFASTDVKEIKYYNKKAGEWENWIPMVAQMGLSMSYKENPKLYKNPVFLQPVYEGKNISAYMNPAKRNVLDLKNETCKNREKRNVLKISHTRHFKTTKKQSKTGCFYSF